MSAHEEALDASARRLAVLESVAKAARDYVTAENNWDTLEEKRAGRRLDSALEALAALELAL